MTERRRQGQRRARDGDDEVAGVGELKAVAGRLLDTGSGYLEDAWDTGRHWLTDRRDDMKRQDDWYQDDGRRGRRDDDESGRSPTHNEVRGRYLRQDGPDHPQPVHWQPDPHGPGRDLAGTNPASADRGNYRGHGPRGYVRTDDRIFEDVCERLSDDPMVDASDIEVRCQDGQVTLDGTVAGRWMKHRAEDIADSVSGVQDIDNRIRVARASRSRAAGRDDRDQVADERGMPPQQPH